MSRLILVPQLPVKMRYTEWWFDWLPKQYAQHFHEVIVLGAHTTKLGSHVLSKGHFAPLEVACRFEAEQIKEYAHLDLRKDDRLLLCDLSFPGMFASILFGKRPQKAFAICHATSRNAYDIWAPVRYKKWGVEKAHASLFDTVFVGSYYHAQKLGWANTIVTGMPHPPISLLTSRPPTHTGHRPIEFGSAARRGIQKVNTKLEREFSKAMGPIVPYQTRHWDEYYGILSRTKFLIITSREETFGYQVIDALKMGTIPIAPRAFSYPELLPSGCLYKPGSVDSIICTVNDIKSRPENLGAPSVPDDHFIQRTLEIMLQ